MIEKDLAGASARRSVRISPACSSASAAFQSDPDIRADMNKGFVVSLAAFVDSQKSGVSGFIAEQVKR